MARIFLSHSSLDEGLAIGIRDWLIGEGWDDLFLDLDPDRGLVAGERWQEALKSAAERCEMVLFLITPNWINSKWCIAEFLLAKHLNKHIFGIIVAPTQVEDIPVEMTSEWQLVDLTSGELDKVLKVKLVSRREKAKVKFNSEGLQRLKNGLLNAGLDARYFAWPPEHDRNRSPYRGLNSLEEEDAGIFFGREGQIVEAMDRLRGIREKPPPRLLTILGASGSGKSSFMRAGLLPRLERDNRHFIVLPVVRPGYASIDGENGLIASLEGAFRARGLKISKARIRSAIAASTSSQIELKSKISGDKNRAELKSQKEKKHDECISDILLELVQTEQSGIADGVEGINPPSLILPIDQAEELYFSEGAREALIFNALLKELVTSDKPALIAVLTIRTDAYEYIQFDKELGPLRQQTLSLPPIPYGSYGEVIRGPARRLEGSDRALVIEDNLVEALLQDIEDGGAKDALPLLAFTLERLYQEYGGDGDLKLDEYHRLGGIRGSIEAAVENALKKADLEPNIPKERDARLSLLRRGLVPWLAGVDPETGEFRRKVAKLSQIPEESRPLMMHLVEQRLLAIDVANSENGEQQETTIEPAHEALLRQWGLLEGWLKEDFEALSVLEGVQRASMEWEANDRSPQWLAHTAGRLESAEKVASREDLRDHLTQADRNYLTHARKEENERRNKELETQRQITRRTRIGLVAAVVLSVIASTIGGYAFLQSVQLSKERDQSNQLASSLKKNQDQLKVNQQALSDQNDQLKEQAAALKNERDQSRILADSLDEKNRELETRQKELKTQRDQAQLLNRKLANAQKQQRIAIAQNTKPLIENNNYSEALALAMEALSRPDQKELVTAEAELAVWSALDGYKEQAVLEDHEWYPHTFHYLENGQILTASWDWRARLFDGETGELIRTYDHDGALTKLVLLADGKRFLTSTSSGTGRLFDIESGKVLQYFDGHDSEEITIGVSGDEKYVATIGNGKTILHSLITGQSLGILPEHTSPIITFAFDHNSEQIWLFGRGKTERGYGDVKAKPADPWFGYVRLDDLKQFHFVAKAGFQYQSVNTGSIVDEFVFLDTSGELRFFNHKTRKWTRRFKPDGKAVSSFQVSENRDRILINTEQETSVWSLVNFNLAAKFGPFKNKMMYAGFGRNMDEIFFVFDDSTVKLADIRQSTELETVNNPGKLPALIGMYGNSNRFLTTSSGQFSSLSNKKTLHLVRQWNIDFPVIYKTKKYNGRKFSSITRFENSEIFAATNLFESGLGASPQRLVGVAIGRELAFIAHKDSNSKVLISYNQDRLIRIDQQDKNPVTIDIYNVTSGEVIHHLKISGHGDKFHSWTNSLGMSENGKYLALSLDYVGLESEINDAKQTLYIIDSDSGEITFKQNLSFEINYVNISNDGKLLAFLDKNKKLYFASTEELADFDPDRFRSFPGVEGEFKHLGNSDQFYAFLYNNLVTCRLSDKNCQEISIEEEGAYYDEVAGRFALASSTSGHKRLIKLDTGRTAWKSDHARQQVKLSPDGNRLIIWDQDQLKVIDTTKFIAEITIDIKNRKIAQLHVHNQYMIVLSDEKVYQIDYRSGMFKLVKADVRLINDGIIFARGGERFALLFSDGLMTVFNMDGSNFNTISRSEFEFTNTYGKRPRLLAGGETVYGFTHARGNKTDDFDKLLVINSENWETTKKAHLPQDVVLTGLFNFGLTKYSDNSLYFYWSNGVFRFNLNTNKLSKLAFPDRFKHHPPLPYSYYNFEAISENGDMIAYVTDNNQLWLADTRTGSIIQNFGRLKASYSSRYYFTDDDRYFVAAQEASGDDKMHRVRVFDTENKLITLDLKGGIKLPIGNDWNWAANSDNSLLLPFKSDNENETYLLRFHFSPGSQNDRITDFTTSEKFGGRSFDDFLAHTMSNNGKRVAILTKDKIYLYDRGNPSGEIKSPFSGDTGWFATEAERKQKEAGGFVEKIEFVPENRLLITTSENDLLIYDLELKKKVTQLKVPNVEDAVLFKEEGFLITESEGALIKIPIPRTIKDTYRIGCETLQLPLSAEKRIKYNLPEVPAEYPCGLVPKKAEKFSKQKYLEERKNTKSTPSRVIDLGIRYGAIAYSPRTQETGIEVSAPSREDAKRSAMEACSRKADDCEDAGWVRNACNALAIASDGAWGAHWAHIKEQAEINAVKRCHDFGPDCKVKVSVCTVQ